MSINNYDILRVNVEAPLSVGHWNELVDTLRRVDGTLNRVRLSAADRGRVGIGTEPLAALHVSGDGGRSDDVLIESTTITATKSAAIFLDRKRTKDAPLKVNDLTGLLEMRGVSEAKVATRAGMRSIYRGTVSGGRHQNDLVLFNTVKGARKDMLVLHQDGHIKLNVPISGSVAGGRLKIKTTTGTVEIGSGNANEAHFITDRSQFYFGKRIVVNGGQFSGRGINNLSLRTSDATWLHILGGTSTKKGFVGINTTSPANRLHVRGNLSTQYVNAKERGWILMRTSASNANAKILLKSLANNQSIIAGAWDDYFYFYWKNKKGQQRRAMIKGHSF